MSKNHYLKLEKDDLVFVSSKKENTKLFIFDGEEFNELGEIEITLPNLKIGDSITDELSYRNRNLFT